MSKPTNNDIAMLKPNIWAWQYNGVAPFHELVLWCQEHVSGQYAARFETIYFSCESDYIMFVLRWT